MTKETPAPVKLALAALEHLAQKDPAFAEEAKKKLPGFALRLAAAGEEVTVEGLVASARAGEINRIAALKPVQKTYEEIIAHLPEEEEEEPLHEAIAEFEKVRVATEAGDINAIKEMAAGGMEVGSYLSILNAIHYNQLEIIKYFAEECGTGLQTGYGDLLNAAVIEGHLDIVKYLVEECAEIKKALELFLHDALKCATTSGRLEIIKYLIEEAGPKLKYNSVNLSEHLFLLAAANGRLDVLKYFSHLCDKRLKRSVMLHLQQQAMDSAMRANRLHIIKHFVEECGVALDNRVDSALTMSYLDMVKYMLAQGSTFTLAPDTALRMIVKREANSWVSISQARIDTAEYIIKERGADVSVLNETMQQEIKNYFEACNIWERLFHFKPTFKMALEDSAYFRPQAYQAVYDILVKEGYRENFNLLSSMSFHIAGLFGTESRVLQYLEKWGIADKQPLHNIAQMIMLPVKKTPGMDLKAWGDAVLKCGPSMANLVKFADKLPVPEKSDDGRTWSMVKTREKVAQFAYDRAPENNALAALCMEHGITGDVFNKALDLSKNAPVIKNIPDIAISGEQFDMPGAKFYRLAANDIRGLFLGEMTDCCQSLGKQGATCATHGFASENGGFYVVENTKGRVIGQTWAWRGKKGELVFDSLETLGGHVKTEQWRKLTAVFAEVLALKSADITALHIGTGGATPYKLSTVFNVAASPAKPLDYKGYRDSGDQIVVWRRKQGGLNG